MDDKTGWVEQVHGLAKNSHDFLLALQAHLGWVGTALALVAALAAFVWWKWDDLKKRPGVEALATWVLRFVRSWFTEFIPLKEAAMVFYDRARHHNSVWAPAAEHLGASNLKGPSSEEECLDWTATFICKNISLYGRRPPSKALEEITDHKRGIFLGSGNELWLPRSGCATYTNLKVKRGELTKLIDERVIGGLKTNTAI
jgi:hypothetical protein